MTTAPEMPTPIWSGTFQAFGVDVKAHVLPDGTRIIEADSFAALIEAMSHAADGADDLAKLMAWQRGGQPQ